MSTELLKEFNLLHKRLPFDRTLQHSRGTVFLIFFKMQENCWMNLAQLQWLHHQTAEHEQ